ncbi:uncharacterized protein BDZ83DRAFT_3645 [Colletotrichum acutatum]|uniref:Uncharacterized protein n=1 Tax=Glomerella acutata TaxID=27357 RepID=A0AAD8XQC5_GLOAC|nr:uncharacterized protein BDZ83DRAFT_3645 [Colletotrichum acutatum]KAK1731762.1 hypothetical protein BDZ83DRAFT_3645 [Colletotrichum acutatum]
MVLHTSRYFFPRVGDYCRFRALLLLSLVAPKLSGCISVVPQSSQTTNVIWEALDFSVALQNPAAGLATHNSSIAKDLGLRACPHRSYSQSLLSNAREGIWFQQLLPIILGYSRHTGIAKRRDDLLSNFRAYTHYLALKPNYSG